MPSKRPTEPVQPLTVRQAGRNGGRVTASRYGSEHYRAIGKKGGQSVRRLLDRGLAAERAEQAEGERHG